MKKNNSTPATKSDMIAKLAKRGLTSSEIRTKVLEVYATCYYSEISRIKNKVADQVAA